MQNPTERPAESLDSIPPGLAVQERERQTALLTVRRLRKEASAEIERLIAFMDETDGYTGNELEGDDADFEDDGGGEPSLGSFDSLLNQTKAWRTSLVSADTDAELDDCDREPSLATPEDKHGSQDQRLWEYGCRKDLEDEHDGAEPDDECDGRPDDEPSLGWTIDGVMAGFDDREDGIGADVRAARARGPSETPGVSVDGGRGYITQITGLTARQKELLGTEWLRR